MAVSYTHLDVYKRQTLGWTNGSNGTVISNPAVMLWNAIGSLTQPIFQRGKLIANLKAVSYTHLSICARYL